MQPLWKAVWRLLKKLVIELPYDPAIPLLGIHTEETTVERDICTPTFITTLFTIAGHGSNLDIHHRRVGKKAVVYIHNRKFSSVQFSSSVISNSL